MNENNNTPETEERKEEQVIQQPAQEVIQQPAVAQVAKPGKKGSALGVWAIVLSIFPILHLLGGLFALIDLIFRHKKVRVNRAIVGLVFSLCWTTLFCVLLYKPVKNYVEVRRQLQDPSALVSKQLIETGTDSVYYVSDKMTAISVKSYFNDKPSVIRYKVTTAHDYEIAGGEIKYKSKWKIDCNGLAYGPNFVTITYVYDDESLNKEFSYLIYNSNEANAEGLAMKNEDSDGDGLTDYFEITNSETDPYIFDTDTNGISDADEDFDNDGLTNIEEQSAGTFARIMDSDGDGLFDGEEVAAGTDPLKEDSDEDGFTDGDELRFGKDPLDKDDLANDAVVSITEVADFNSNMTVELNVKAAAKDIQNLHVFEVPETFSLSKENVTGMIGTAISISMGDAQPEEAEISITLDCDDYVPGEDYYLYYFNEDSYEFEYVEGQIQNDNIITARLPHFSKYVVSSISGEGVENLDRGVPEYKKYGIDFVTDELPSGLYPSYEEYVKAMYSGQAVYSINIFTPDMDDAKAYADGAGHTWTSYCYEGSDPDLEFNIIDKGNSTETSFGAIGYGAWTENSSALEALVKTYNAEIKLPNGYRNLYYDGTEDENGNIVYQSKTLGYDGKDMTPENMNNAFVSMPFVIDGDNLSKISDFIDGYKEKYDLNVNNCTTFARDLLNAGGIKHSINICINGDGALANKIAGSAGSPGQAAYSVQTEYPYEHVYMVLDYLDDGTLKCYFTSKMAQECALKQEREKIQEIQGKEEARRLEEERIRESMPGSIKEGKGRFAVFFSPIAVHFGAPVFIMQETSNFRVNVAEQDKVQAWLDMKGDQNGTWYIYCEGPKVVFNWFLQEYVPEGCRFGSRGEYSAWMNKPRTFDEYIKDYCIQFFSIEMDSYEFFTEFI